MTGLRTKTLYLAFLALAFVYVEGSRQGLLAGSPPPPICSDVCSTSACADECYVDLMEFENGNAITCLDYGEYDFEQYCCGDDICRLDLGEAGSCTSDCPDDVPPPPGCGECDPVAQDCTGTNTVCTASACCVQLCDGSS